MANHGQQGSTSQVLLGALYAASWRADSRGSLRIEETHANGRFENRGVPGGREAFSTRRAESRRHGRPRAGPPARTSPAARRADDPPGKRGRPGELWGIWEKRPPTRLRCPRPDCRATKRPGESGARSGPAAEAETGRRFERKPHPRKRDAQPNLPLRRRRGRWPSGRRRGGVRPPDLSPRRSPGAPAR